MSDARAVQTFEYQPVRATISFRAARDVVAIVAHNAWVPGEYFCLRDIEVLENAIRDIKEKIIAQKLGDKPCPDCGETHLYRVKRDVL